VTAVLFDLDGTLIDTAPEFIHIGLQLRAEAGLAPIEPETIWHSVSDGAIGMVQAALECQRTILPLSSGGSVFSHCTKPVWATSAIHTPAAGTGCRSAESRNLLGCCHQQTGAICAPADG
jgi:phosphoglycolate phosphatase-like HAD superfamily hydrolase